MRPDTYMASVLGSLGAAVDDPGPFDPRLTEPEEASETHVFGPGLDDGEGSQPFELPRSVRELPEREAEPPELSEDVEDGRWAPYQSEANSIVTETGSHQGADVVAEYRPFHIHGPAWGIFVSEARLGAYTLAHAIEAKIASGFLAPLVLRQILEHERTHFAVELGATSIEDAARQLSYGGYLSHRFDTSLRGLPAPLEEALANHREVAYARSRLRLAAGRSGLPAGPSLRGYVDAVEAIASRGPAGYRDHRVFDTRSPPPPLADLAELVADRPLVGSGWFPKPDRFISSPPMYWIGNGSSLGTYGAIQKTVAAPTVREFERWVVRQGGRILQGKRHCKAVLPRGGRCPYTCKRKRQHLLEPEARNIASRLGISRKKLFEIIRAGEALPQPRA